MARAKMVLSWCIPLVLITVALMTPAVAEAKSIKVWPDQLRPLSPNNPYSQAPTNVSNGTFYAPFTLSVGAKITKVTYYHFGEESPSTTVTIHRAKMESPPDQLASGSSTDSTEKIIPVDVVFTDDPIIRAGYRYYIWVTCSGACWFHGVKITYQE